MNSDGEIPMEMDLTIGGPPPTEDEESQIASSMGETCGDRCTRYAKIILPHVGLVLLLGIYTICGAAIFYLIELPNEETQRDKWILNLNASKYNITDQLFNLTMWSKDNKEQLNEDTFRSVGFSAIQELEERLFLAFSENYIKVEHLRNESYTMWTFSSSIFFASTVITTIGYGHMVPTTVYGKVFCIVFGLFGIPLLLITIADIGKFLSDFISFLYRSYRLCKFHIKKRSKQLSMRRKTKHDVITPLPDTTSRISDSESSGDEIRIPVIMVILFLVGYTAIGGVLFQMWEKWKYFDAFYFCFITMATIGFGDFVPKQQLYMFFTIIYIVIGLAITTMCIDLAGTEYIRKIHFVGQKIETAKEVVGGAVVSGLHVGGGLVKIAGYGLKSAGGKFLHTGDQVMISMRHAAALRRAYGLPPDFDLGRAIIPDGMTEEEFYALHPEERRNLHNILFEPLHPDVQRVLKPHIKLHPDEITDRDAFVLENKLFDRQPKKRQNHNNETIQTQVRPSSWPKSPQEAQFLIVPFILRESNV